jgi:hypothetical protein
MTEADDFFAAARRLGEQISAQRVVQRQAVKDARNARRRQRYAAAPKPVRPAKSVVVLDDDYEVDPGCRCQVVPTPPCSWCESGSPGREDDAL